ncbi:transglutaminaseTgpA domain-containing protein [Microbacterium amylolyticum]|uniref:Transglutaminase-like putative cysteine protease n=1 Tax=Microbacterium amylolyticum TaxID=936337 RepID=A0ABS4ZJH6_9MICO|nr:DUF3488 and transglutaminase-like domain-containing protein [Microbacterium amylolyticum]MBP2437444.1 transglutaminase-like putative cysteine protease [Microbacterium amylolyticum]
MSADQAQTAPRRQPPSVVLSIAVAVGVVAAVFPLTTLLSPSWVPGAVLAVTAIVGVGLLARFAERNGDLIALGAQMIVWTASLFVAYPGQVLGGLIPLPGSPWGLPSVFRGGIAQIVESVAPVDVGPALAFLLIAATGLIALAVDQLTGTARVPVVASLPLILIFVLPQLAVPRGSHLLHAVPLAVAIVTMIALGGMPRHRITGQSRRRVTAVTAGIAAVAIIAAFVIAPRLPFVSGDSPAFFARGSSVDVSLDLGDDLRRNTNVEVMRVRTEGGAAPYLRLATHTAFEGGRWHLDDGPLESLAQGFGAVSTTGEVGEVELSSQITHVEIVDLDAARLPVPANALSVSGASAGWQGQIDNRTVRGDGLSSRDEVYSVHASSPQPTLEQAQASPWPAMSPSGDPVTNGLVSEDTLSLDGLAPDHPIALAAYEAIGLDADVMTGSAGNRAAALASISPYDALVALEQWFRSDAFTYSLSTPLEGGFDSSSVDAMEAFLEVREGYCVHFASTFAIMARSLGIPTRVAVGYLPGAVTDRVIDGNVETTVESDQLHAWPEVYLVGIGWTAFDPTPGVANAQGQITDSDNGAAPEPAEPEPEEEQPQPEETPAEDEPAESNEDETSGPEEDTVADDDTAATWSVPWRTIIVIALAILLLALPAGVRLGIRVSHVRRARRGDIGAAWRELRNSAIDAYVIVTATDSPRAFGERLTTAGAPEEAVSALVTSIEHASFASHHVVLEDLSGPLTDVRKGIRRPGMRGVIDAMLPRSLRRR